jgi:RecB family endonuclease NucS
MIGKLQRVPLRDVWHHEARDFTHWLQENIEVLNEVLDLNLGSVEREQAAGSFSVDLVAEDENGNLIVIENQLERSDHDNWPEIQDAMIDAMIRLEKALAPHIATLKT